MARKGSRSGPPAAPAGGLHGAPKRKRTPPTADEAAADTAPHASKSVRTTARGVSRAKASRARSPPPGEGDDFEDDLGEHFAEPGDAAVASMTVAARRAAGKKPKKLRVATRHQKQPEAQQATRSCSSRDAWTAAPVSGTPQTASSQPHRPTFRQAPAHELDPGTQPLGLETVDQRYQELSAQVSGYVQLIQDPTTREDDKSLYRTLVTSLVKQQEILAEERKIRALTVQQSARPSQQIPAEVVPLLVSGENAIELARAGFRSNEELTKWLRALAAAAQVAPAALDEQLQVVEIDTNYDMFEASRIDKQSASAAGTAIFVRDCYRQLLEEVWKHRKVALIGNPGTGKSRFQAYVILRLLQDKRLRGEIKCVIRQVAPGTVYLFLLEELQAYQASPADIRAFLTAFDQSKCLYLFEPAGDKGTEPVVVGMKTLATVSPNRRRIQEFLKSRGSVPRYMPLWKEAELLALGAFLGRQEPENEELQRLYSEAAIRERFAQYGGILRYVLPTTEAEAEKNQGKFDSAMSTVDYKVFARAGVTIDDPEHNISHFHLQYDVDQTEFATYTLRFSGERAKQSMETALQRADYGELKEALRGCEVGILPERAWFSLERITPMVWARGGTDWIQHGDSRVPLPARMEYTNSHEGDVPRNWRDFTKDLIYVVGKVNFPFVEALFVTSERPAVMQAYQCKTGSNAQKPNAKHAYELRQKLGMTSTDKMHVWYIVMNRHAEAWLRALTRMDAWDQPKTVDGTRLRKEITGQYANIIKNTTFGVLCVNVGL